MLRSSSNYASAIEVRSLTLDFGRRTGKSAFAKYLLQKRDDVVVITPTLAMLRHITYDLLYEYSSREGEGRYAEIGIFKDKLKETLISQEVAIRQLRSRENTRIKEAPLIVFDEYTQRIHRHREMVGKILSQAGKNTEFIFLGR